MLTDKQIENIRNLQKEDLVSILHECAEVLGIVSVDEYCQATGMKRRTVYQLIKEKRIKSIKIAGHIYPMINYF